MKLAVFIFGVFLPLLGIALPEKSISKDELNEGAVALDGLWAFDWESLHTDMHAPMKDGIRLPGLWHKQGPYSPQGFATLRLVVNMPAVAPYYLRLPDIPSAVSLWVNGEQLFQRGIVSDQADYEKPKFGPKVLALPPAQTYNVILHISNHHHKEGGVWHDLKIADEAHQVELRSQSKTIDTIIFSFLMLASIYLLVINLSRHGHVSHLLFAAFIWAIALRSVVVGERIAYDFVSGMSWANWQRLEHILLFLALPAFVYFFHRFFSLKNMYFAHGVFLISLVSVFGTFISPPIIFTGFAEVNQLLGLATVVYIAIYTSILIKQNVQYSIWFAVSFIGAAFFVIHDYLYTHLFIQSRPLSQFGMVFFVALQIYMLWLHRKQDIKLMMFVKSSIDHKAQDVLRPLSDVKDETFHMGSWLAQIKPYCDVLNVSVVVDDSNFTLNLDKEKLQNIVLILARMADKNGMRVVLSIDQLEGSAVFKMTLNESFNAQQYEPENMNAVHHMLNDLGTVLTIKRLPKQSIFEFSLNTSASKSHRSLDVEFKGNELAASILFNSDDSGVLEDSLASHFYLVKSSLSRENIIKYRPRIIIWQVDAWDAYIYEDMKSLMAEFSAIPILLIIHHQHKAQLAQCIRIGITDYIVTPVQPEELLLKVQRVQEAVKDLPLPISNQDIRDVTVQLIRSSIALWQKYSNKTKVDLAEQSGLWRVYVDGSTAKTRTLDKYLSLQSLPKNPRWETVTRTASYVFEECDLDEKDKKSLSQQMELFNKLLAV